jgi:hypothetical protein
VSSDFVDSNAFKLLRAADPGHCECLSFQTGEVDEAQGSQISVWGDREPRRLRLLTWKMACERLERLFIWCAITCTRMRASTELNI